MSLCTTWRTALAAQTPVYDKVFLEDYTPMDSATIGRHQTSVWEMGSGDTHYFDTMTVGQPNLQDRWQRIDASDCSGSNPCQPPRSYVGMGSRRNSYYPEQKELRGPTFCLTQLEHSTRPEEQMQEWMKGIKQIPELYTEDFIRVHAFDLNTTVHIAQGSNLTTFTPVRSGVGQNLVGQLTTIDLAGTANLPTSRLTWPYLRRLTTALQLAGYHKAPSGLPDNMYNLITGESDWFGLTNGNDALKSMMALTDYKQASPLYKLGEGIQTPYGNIAPTIDGRQMRFQHVGNGVLNRVEPYINVPTTTGIEPRVNTAYLDAQFALSFIWHPMAIKVFTRDFKKIHDKVPSVNSSLYGQWSFINDNPLLTYQPDGTLCTLDNPQRNQFYWLCELYLGFQYMYPKFIIPILHQTDASGKCQIIADPVCCSAPQYVPQDYRDNPVVCE